MQSVTLLLSAVASVAVFLLSPVYGLIVYIAAFAYYPTYLSVPVGTIDFTVRRIVILAIFVNLFLRTDLPSRFKFIWLDKLVVVYFLCQILAGVVKGQLLTAFLENRAGAVFDMVLPYFAVRMIMGSKQQYLVLLKGILIIAAPLAIVGFYQCLTGNNPAGFLRKYFAWRPGKAYVPIPRFGLFRADVTFSHSIMYGLFFAMFGPVCAGLFRHIRKNKLVYAAGAGLMGLGVFSSMSAGPWLALAMAIPFICLWRWRKRWKLIVATVIIMCTTVEIISNRHFYEVIDRFTFSGYTAWYRSKLISVALFEGGMSGHWLTGFPFGTDPGWGPLIDGRGHTDAVNHYIFVLCTSGLIGLIPFLAVIGAAIKRLVDSYKLCSTKSDEWIVWCLAGALFGILGAMNSVMLFGPPVTIFYIMLAFCGSMPGLMPQEDAQPVLTRRELFGV